MLTSIITGPFKGLLFIARKVDEAVQQEREQERAATMETLRRLHLQYEAGQIEAAAFEEQEEILLNRLDNLS